MDKEFANKRSTSESGQKSDSEKDDSLNISVLSIGMIVKNYKVLCGLQATMGALIQYAFSRHCNIRSRLLVALYDYNKYVFLECFILVNYL